MTLPFAESGWFDAQDENVILTDVLGSEVYWENEF